jgi:hypothetical protein
MICKTTKVKESKKMKQLVRLKKMTRRLMMFATLVTLINVSAFAQRISSSDINYWVGSGSHEAILILNFCDDNAALAWGFRFEGTLTAGVMLAAIDAADLRLSITGPPSSLSDYSYQDATNNFKEQGPYPWYGVNELMVGMVDVQPIVNGDIVEVGNNCAYISPNWDSVTFSIPVTPVSVPPPTIHAKSGDGYSPASLYGSISPVGDSTVIAGASITYTFTPNSGYHVGSVLLGGNEVINSVVNNTYTVTNIVADDTLWVKFAVDKNNTITTNDILYWVGTGSNSVIFAVNWCNPQIAFAWGYRFNDSVTVAKVMEDIKAADPRFDYVDGGGYVTEITYKDNTYDLSLNGDYWGYNVNEESALMVNGQYVSNNDVIESGATSCGLLDDFWTNVWTTTITPVTVPSGVNIVSAKNTLTDITLYPNPATDHTYLTLNEQEGEVVMTIVDVNGKVIQQEEFEAKNGTVKRIETGNFSKGIYFVRLQGNNHHQTQKLIIY